jgi:hypothetical protein
VVGSGDRVERVECGRVIGYTIHNHNNTTYTITAQPNQNTQTKSKYTNQIKAKNPQTQQYLSKDHGKKIKTQKSRQKEKRKKREI